MKQKVDDLFSSKFTLDVRHVVISEIETQSNTLEGLRDMHYLCLMKNIIIIPGMEL